MRSLTTWLAATAIFGMMGSALAEGQYDPGASDDAIKIGNTNPYSGPASAYGAIGRAIGAYFDKVNAEGGINGRKIDFISYDDGYSPPKTKEQVRKLKTLGLTISHSPGYELSPRGRALLDALD